MEKTEITSNVQDAFSELKDQLKPFLIHVYIKHKQAAHMEKLKNEVDEKKILLQVDFSENATLLDQNEIQSAHWSHAQATIFTAHAWIKAENDTKESLVIVSDELQHTKVSVHAFMASIISTLKNKYATITEIDIFSDGASSQFKQRYLFSNLHTWEQQFGLSLRWHFFATSHGKGVVDGLGGTVKRSVWRYVRSGQGQASTPLSFHNVAVQRNPNINVMFMAKENILHNEGELQAHWACTIPIPNTHKLHFVSPRGAAHLLISDTSDSEQYTEARICKENPNNHVSMQDNPNESRNQPKNDVSPNIHIGDWVLVKSGRKSFPGEISELCPNSKIRVKAMHKSARNWNWPNEPDNICYNQQDIVRKINAPFMHRRGKFSFSSL